MRITQRDLKRWKDNSIQLAMTLGYDQTLLNSIDKNTKLTLIRGLPPEGNWYGWCMYGNQEIQVYHRNLSTEPREILIAAMQSKGIPIEAITQIMKAYDSMEKEAFFEKMVIPRSFSSGFESMIVVSPFLNSYAPVCFKRASTIVVFPWSTCAIIATFLIFFRRF